MSVAGIHWPALLNIGVCANYVKVLPQAEPLGSREGNCLAFFFLAFILTKADKSSEPIDLYAIKTSKEI